MSRVFCEEFEIGRAGLPGGWYVEKNSNLAISGLSFGEKEISLLSPGNCFFPVIPDVTEFALRAEFLLRPDLTRVFSWTLAFHYNLSTRQGEACRTTCHADEKTVVFEYGFISRNVFVPEQRIELSFDPIVLERAFHFELSVRKDCLKVSLENTEAEITVHGDGTGKIGLSRGAFMDVFKVLKFEIDAELPRCRRERSFRIPMPTEPTLYPIFCNVLLRDYGDCMEAELTFSGGVAETRAGEGNYHVVRMDFLDRPFLKVLTETQTDEYVCCRDLVLLTVPEITPPHIWKTLHRHYPWPLTRSVRFMKPDEPFNLAVGFDSYRHSTLPEFEQSPSETVFDLQGSILSSGLGISSGKCKTEFLSRPDKRMMERLPLDDPRHKDALEFLKNNHYFIEGEDPLFRIRLTAGNGVLPASYAVKLEDAFFNLISELSFDCEEGLEQIGVRQYPFVILSVRMPSGALSPGVYHLRVCGTDPTVSYEEYCAFEVMDADPASPPPPVLSGLPFLYNSRSETRGLETDAFDPWKGISADCGHYITCTNFLPAAARKYHIAPTVHAYGRKWFLWLGARCADKWRIRENLDLIAEADYVSVIDEKQRVNLLWQHAYTGWLLEKFYQFAKTLNDSDFDMSALEKRIQENGESGKATWIDPWNYSVMSGKHWYEWLEYINREFTEKEKTLFAELRKINPAIRFAEYGPAPVYGARLKGPEFIRYLLNEYPSPEMWGFRQYEDYPFACSYGLERGVFFLTSCLMWQRGESCIYPEIYTRGTSQGCPDGAVFYAYPPFGIRPYTDLQPLRMIRQVYEFAFASGWFDGSRFHFWEKCGFQASGFWRPWYENLLKAWNVVRANPPEQPLRSAAFVFSDESFRNGKTLVDSGCGALQPLEDGMIADVRKTAAEDVPYVYEIFRRHGFCAGFQVMMESLSGLTAEQTNLLVLPPLCGVSGEYLAAVRKLHARGVALLAFEDVSGLEDLFGVTNTGKDVPVRNLQARPGFAGGAKEYCANDRCRGRYRISDPGTEVLIDAEVPVLTYRKNDCAGAAFFNVPPHLVHEDELWNRLSYGRDGISKLMENAVVEIIRKLTDPEVAVSAGYLIAFRSRKQQNVIIVCNSDEEQELPAVLTVRKTAAAHLVSCDKPHRILSGNGLEYRIRLRLGRGESAVLIFQAPGTE